MLLKDKENFLKYNQLLQTSVPTGRPGEIKGTAGKRR